MRNRKNALARADEAVSVARGEISAAESTLQRIADQIASTAHFGIGCALGDKRDCIALAVGLANEEAQQQAEIRDLEDRLRDQVFDRNSLKTDVDLDRNDVKRILSDMSANGC